MVVDAFHRFSSFELSQAKYDSSNAFQLAKPTDIRLSLNNHETFADIQNYY